MQHRKRIVSIVLSLILLCNLPLHSMADSTSYSQEKTSEITSSINSSSELDSISAEQLTELESSEFYEESSQSPSDFSSTTQNLSSSFSQITENSSIISDCTEDFSSSSSQVTEDLSDSSNTTENSSSDLSQITQESSDSSDTTDDSSDSAKETASQDSSNDSETDSTESENSSDSSEIDSTESEASSNEQGFTEEDQLAEFSLLDFECAANYAAITSCQITADDQFTVTASLQQEIPSLDKKLYLFELETYESSIEKKKPIVSIDLPKKPSVVTLTASLNTNQESSRLYSKFALAVFGADDRYYLVSNFSHITNPQALASNQNGFPSSSSKKGLLTNSGMFSDIDELNVQHALVNIELNRLLTNGDLPYNYNGNTYYINSNAVASYDASLKYMADNNIVTSCVLLANHTPSVPELTHPKSSGSSAYYALNTATKEGVRAVSAIIHFLAERYTRTDKAYGYIANWIVGNEVNNPNAWNNMGSSDFTSYMQDYSRAIRIVSTAVKSSYKSARVYVSLDHYW